MEENDLFFKLISQKHLLTNILNNLSFKDCYNLISKNEINYKWTNSKCEHIIDSELLIEKLILGINFFPNANEYYLNKKINKYIEVESRNKKMTTNDITKLYCNKSIQLINEITSIKGLFIDSSYLPKEKTLEDVIKEIKNCNVQELDINLKDNIFDEKNGQVIFNTTENVFNGFTNLKKIKFVVEDFILTDVYKNIINIISNIDGMTIEIECSKTSFSDFVSEIFIKSEDFMLTNILRKKINLIITRYYFKISHLLAWLEILTISDLSYLKSLYLCLPTINRFRKFTTFLPYMVNLEWLGIKFDIKVFAIMVEFSTLRKLHEYEEFFYKSFKNLEKLKTIQIECILTPKDSCMKGHSWIVANDGDIIDSKIIIQNEIFSFLSYGPKSLKNLFISGISNLSCSETLLLSQFFPNLKLLYLRNIVKSENDCLKYFKNLEFYVCCNVGNLYLPDNVDICLVCNKNNLFEEIINNNMFMECCEYQIKSNKFTKTCTLDGDIKGKVFFNHFYQLYGIHKYLKNIYEVIMSLGY
ncbi:Hypothetical protein SRAE_1000082600 [Strongyloides ratti]|uniref:F-box domain-containing protein n=1 Tax=Strongyloides ratti TaxID=34506 RepID=A0A090KYP3_STRRB|nr:Hypothetical protein SRAE_1000082600 [Strongyloides ratti]CEF62556.1 Hypothetical protein SRAE_1000082600 [Strongyloides ratti]